MAAFVVPNNNSNGMNQKQITKMTTEDIDSNNSVNYTQRGQWLRAAILGANDGLVSVASLMMGIGAVKRDVKAMLLGGFAGSVAGACAMAIGEFVSVYAQYEVEIGQIKRDNMNVKSDHKTEEDDEKLDVEMMGNMQKMMKSLPNPLQAALASAFAFSVGAILPLLSAAFITDYKVRLMVVVAVASFALMVFGVVGAQLGKTPKVRSCARVLVGGWIAMAVTYGLTKIVGSTGLE